MGIKKVLVGLVVVFIIWKIFDRPKFPELPYGTIKAYAGNTPKDMFQEGPCAWRSQCVVLYMAPWCHFCKEKLPLIQELREAWKKWDRPGLMVILGNAKPEALQEMAMDIKAPVFFDPKDRFLDALNIPGFPFFMVVDSSKNIVARGQKAEAWVMKEAHQ